MAERANLPAVAEPSALRELLLPTVMKVKERLNLPCPIDVRPVGEGLALVIDDKDYPILRRPARINLDDAGQVETFKQTFAAYAENAMKEHLDEGGVSPCRPRLTRRAMAILADIEARTENEK